MDVELARLAEDAWSALQRETHAVAAGLKARPDFAAIYSRFADVWRDESVAASDDVGGEERRRARRLRAFQVAGRAVFAQGRRIDDRLEAEAKAGAGAEGVNIALRQMDRVLANTPDAEERWALEQAATDAFAELDRIDGERAERWWDAVGEAGGMGQLAALHDLDLEDIGNQAGQLLAETSELAADLLRFELPRKLGITLEQMRRADLPRLERAAWLDQWLGRDAIAVARQQLAELGMSPEAGGRIRIDREDRPSKRSGATCIPLRVPDEVVLVQQQRGGLADHIGFQRVLGEGLIAAYTPADLPFAERSLPDASVVAGIGFLFGGLTADPRWLERYTDARGNAQADASRLAALVELLDARADAGRLLYALEVHAEHRVEGAAERYVERMSRALLARVSAAGHLAVIEDPLGAAFRLRGRAMAATLEADLRERLDEDWFRNPRTAAVLRDLFGGASVATVEDIAGADARLDVLRKRVERLVG